MVSLKTLSPNQKFALEILIPSFYFLPLVVAWFAPKDFGFGDGAVAWLGWGVGVAGVLLWIAAMGALGKSLAVLPGSDRLVAGGVYKYLRHPIYVGIFFTLLGIFIACGSRFGLVYLVVVVLPLNLVRARLEENALQEKFGESYADYKSKTFF